MLIEKNRWARNGIAIAIESVKVLFRNPILFVYAVPILLIPLVFSIFKILINSFISKNGPASVELWELVIPVTIFIGICLVMSAFFYCCLAHHTMHILRKKSITPKESFKWATVHFKQILLWIILLSFVLITQKELFPNPIPESNICAAMAVAIIITGILCLLLCAMLVISIIATEQISTLNALKRALHLVWFNLGTYLAIFFPLYIIASLLMLPMQLLITYYMDSVDYHPYIEFFILLSIIASTIFYYEFYVKNEEVVVYHEQKDF